MKVERTGAATGTAGPRRAERAKSGSSFADALRKAEGPGGTGPATAVTPVGGVLAVQEVDTDAESAARAAIKRGEDILDRLEELRRGLIEGRLPAERLEALVQLCAERRGTVADPRLKAILDDIDLRAQVELAKLGRAS